VRRPRKGHFEMKCARLVDLRLPPLRRTLQRPLWKSLELSLSSQIEIGRVAPGSRVPSTRVLARRLGVSRNTVAIAYDSLVADGYLAPRVGDGTYVLGCAHRAQAAFWERPRRWLRDPDGLLLWMTSDRCPATASASPHVYLRK